MTEDEYRNLKPGDLCVCEDNDPDQYTTVNGYFLVLGRDLIRKPAYNVYWLDDRNRRHNPLSIPCYILEKSRILKP